MSLVARMTIELRRIPDGDDTMTHAVASIIAPGTTMGARTLVQVPASRTIAEAVAEAGLLCWQKYRRECGLAEHEEVSAYFDDTQDPNGSPYPEGLASR